jgi:hypothetical protein
MFLFAPARGEQTGFSSTHISSQTLLAGPLALAAKRNVGTQSAFGLTLFLCRAFFLRFHLFDEGWKGK